MNARNLCLSSPLFFPNHRGDCRKAAGPHLAAGLGEQQRGPQHRQHAEHALLQQQHGLAQPPPPRARPDSRKAWLWFLCQERVNFNINIACCIHPPTQGESQCAPWTSMWESEGGGLPRQPLTGLGAYNVKHVPVFKMLLCPGKNIYNLGPWVPPRLKELVKGWQPGRTGETWPKIPL